MCEHKWERLERPYQYQTDKAEGTSFLDSKVWIICKKCTQVYYRTVGQLSACVPTRFFEAGIGV